MEHGQSLRAADRSSTPPRGLFAAARHALVPDETLVAPEYWPVRLLGHAASLADATRAGLTAQATLIAIGVGRAGATPLASIVVTEINAVAGRMAGLALASVVPVPAVAARATSLVALDCVAGALMGVFSLLLLAFPHWFQAVTLGETLAGAVLGVVAAPAQAALWAHLQRSRDGGVRAEVSRRNQNQTRLVKLASMAAKYAALIWAGGDIRRATAAWLVLTTISTALKLAKLRACVMPTLNLARAAVAFEHMVSTGYTGAVSAAWVTRQLGLVPALSRTQRRLSRRPWDIRRLRMGVEPGDLLISRGVHCASTGSSAGASLHLAARQLLAAHTDAPYVLGADLCTLRLCVVLKSGASARDQIRAAWHAFHACQLLRRHRTSTAQLTPSAVVDSIVQARKVADRDFRPACGLLRAGGFGTGSALFAPGLWRAEKIESRTAGRDDEDRDTTATITAVCRASDGTLRSVKWHCCTPPISVGGGGTGALASPTGARASGRRAGRALAGPHARRSAFTRTVPGTSGGTGGAVGSHPSHRPRGGRAGSSGARLSLGHRARSSLRSVVGRPLASILLPAGYPASVAPEYMRYQLWDTLQVLCADLRGAITNQAGLLAMGVGAVGATAEGVIAVDMATTVLGTVLGLAVGSVCRADRSAAALKPWRLINTAVSVVGACSTLLQGIFPHRRLELKLATTALTSSVKPLRGGADAALVLHLANHSLEAAFVADVDAKEKNQDRVLGLVLLACRYSLLLWVGLDWARAWAVIAVLSAGHLVFNYMAARVLVLPTLNRQRLSLVLAQVDECARAVQPGWPVQVSAPAPSSGGQDAASSAPRAGAGGSGAAGTGTTTTPHLPALGRGAEGRGGAGDGTLSVAAVYEALAADPAARARLAPPAVAAREGLLPCAVRLPWLGPCGARSASRSGGAYGLGGVRFGVRASELVTVPAGDREAVGGGRDAAGRLLAPLLGSCGSGDAARSPGSGVGHVLGVDLARQQLTALLCDVTTTNGPDGAAARQLKAGLHAYRVGRVLANVRWRESGSPAEASSLAQVVTAVCDTQPQVDAEWPCLHRLLSACGWNVHQPLLLAEDWRLVS